MFPDGRQINRHDAGADSGVDRADREPVGCCRFRVEQTSTPYIARNWPRYHRRLYLKGDPAHFALGILVAFPGTLLAFGNQSLLRLAPSVSDSVVLDVLVVSLVASVLGTALVGLAHRLIRKSRRIEAASADERLQEDPRPRILYIRAFVDEDHQISKANPVEKIGDPTAWLREVRFEEALAAGIAPIGVMYAIGKPGEELPPLGAIRRYPEGPWQDMFQSMHRECALVAVQAGHGHGLAYELVEAFKPESFKPILLCFPPASPDAPPPAERYARFKALLEERGITAVLPLSLGRGYFVWFSSPHKGTVLTPREVSFEARRTNEAFPGFTAVRQKFDEIVPGMTSDAVHHSERALAFGHWVLASIGMLVLFLIILLP